MKVQIKHADGEVTIGEIVRRSDRRIVVRFGALGADAVFRPSACTLADFSVANGWASKDGDVLTGVV